MIVVSKIKEAFRGLVGYKNPLNPLYDIVDTTNQESLSGYYVTDNPYAKIELIKDSQDYIDITEEQFNQKLVEIQENSAVNVCNQVFNDIDYIDNNVLYRYPFNKTETDNLPGGFIGYRIRLDNVKHIAIKISKVYLDFNGTGSLVLYLFNSNKKAAIQSKSITVNSDHVESTLDWVLDNTSDIYNGDYYIGYINTTQVLFPYKRDYEKSNVLTSYTHLEFKRVIVLNHSANTLFDVRSANGLSESTGLNFKITVYNDYTDLAIQNKLLFARAIQLDMAINILQNYIASLRTNRNETISAELYQKIMMEIEGIKSKETILEVKGLRPQLLGEITQIKKELDKIRKGYFIDGMRVDTQY